MTISFRINEKEKKQLDEMVKSSGLNMTAFIKNKIFDSNITNTNTAILKHFGAISTELNLIKGHCLIEKGSELEHSFNIIETEMKCAWQHLFI